METYSGLVKMFAITYHKALSEFSSALFPLWIRCSQPGGGARGSLYVNCAGEARSSPLQISAVEEKLSNGKQKVHPSVLRRRNCKCGQIFKVKTKKMRLNEVERVREEL